jgi:lysyl-tRNA synthetase class 1
VYWADELAAAVSGPQIVNDSKSPSGTVHVGSLRGVVLHDAIHRALLERRVPSRRFSTASTTWTPWIRRRS